MSKVRTGLQGAGRGTNETRNKAGWLKSELGRASKAASVGVAGSDHRILKPDPFRILLPEPFFGGFFARKNLEMVDVADILAGVDVDQDGFHWSLFSFRF